MTAIDDVSTNDMNFKHLDTSKDIVITPMNEYGGKALLNADHTWTAKVSDGNNYVGDYPVTIEPNGIVVNSSDFTNLPAGYYHLEIWEEWIDSNSTKQRSIYPSPQHTIDFTIYQNVTDLAEKEIKTIGFQDVVDQAVMNIGMNYVFNVNTIEPDQTATVVQSAADGKNYVTFNIPRGYKGDKGDPGVPGDPGERGLPGNDGLTPQIDAKTGHWMLGNLDTGVTAKGDKGDTGSVDNTGLTNAPAFQALQTQVNNSAVGTNLFVGTKDFGNFSSWFANSSWNIVTDTYNGFSIAQTNQDWGGLSQYIQVSAGETYTFSLYARYTSGTGTSVIYIPLNSNPENGHTLASVTTASTTVSLTSSWQRVSFTFKTTSGGWIRPRIERTSNNTNTLQICGMKLDKGSVATPWCPNPTEILTQSDYAKIKAAIVALGGSLS